MTDRQYRQQGYRDTAKEEKRTPREPSGPRTPATLNSRTVFRCVDCGTLLPSLHDLLGQCPKCSAALHACQQCVHFAPSRRFECTEPVPARIADKRARNECAFFSLRETVEREASSGSGRPDDPRRALDNLFKK